MKKYIKNILTILLFLLFILGIKSNVYAVESNRNIKGVEIKKTQAELKDLMNRSEFEDFDENSSLKFFTVIDENGEDEYMGLGGIGFSKKTIINDIDYINKYFLFESDNYLGESFYIENLGTFKYDGYSKSIAFDDNSYKYKCKIDNNNFKKDDGLIRYFEIPENDLNTGKTYINKIYLTFYKKLFREDQQTGIKLEGTTEILPNNTEMFVENLNKENIKFEDKNRNEFKAYDITLKAEDSKIQPKKEVKINIPIPDNFDAKNLVVYRIENDRKIEYNVNVLTIDNKKYATFKTDHFSTYILAGNEKEIIEDGKEDVKIDEKDVPKQEVTNPELKTEENKQHILDNEPKTGKISVVLIMSVIVAVSIIGFAICKNKMYK